MEETRRKCPVCQKNGKKSITIGFTIVDYGNPFGGYEHVDGSDVSYYRCSNGHFFKSYQVNGEIKTEVYGGK